VTPRRRETLDAEPTVINVNHVHGTLRTGAIEAQENPLVGRGMIFNEVDTSSPRRRLGPFYARWRKIFGLG